MPERNVVAWNAMIKGYAQHGRGNETIQLFEQMQEALMKPNEITFICVLLLVTEKYCSQDFTLNWSPYGFCKEIAYLIETGN
ncbi:hypothetical protein SUGI_0341800 [Cryptomeria japonica]|nr:hypothetical protein SUGI_0341800 [Cryptomeria japonica]